MPTHESQQSIESILHIADSSKPNRTSIVYARNGTFLNDSYGKSVHHCYDRALPRWIEAVVVPDQRVSTVCRAVVNGIVARYRIPEKLLNDQGPCFEGDEFLRCLQKMGIKKIRTTPYHPQSNGLTERNNGRRARLLFDLQVGPWNPGGLSPNKLEETRSLENNNLLQTQEETREKVKARWRVFDLGANIKHRDRRNLRTTGPGSRKLTARWKGPYEVVERRVLVYTIKNETHHMS